MCEAREKEKEEVTHWRLVREAIVGEVEVGSNFIQDSFEGEDLKGTACPFREKYKEQETQ